MQNVKGNLRIKMMDNYTPPAQFPNMSQEQFDACERVVGVGCLVMGAGISGHESLNRIDKYLRNATKPSHGDDVIYCIKHLKLITYG